MEISGSVNTFTLDNGLRVVHRQDTTTAMVALSVTYDVGARDEHPTLTGLAHLYEHMMFGGSVNIPDFDAALSRAGGINNAYTSSDFTTYYAVAPAHNMETLFYCESDRMLCPALSQETLDVQRSVVIEEFKQQCLNSPYGDIFHHLRPMVYPAEHPYSWPVIGKTPEHIKRITSDDLQEWFRVHYAPASAVLSLSGNIPLEQTKQLAQKWFGSIPYREPYVRNIPQIMPHQTAATKTISGRVPATMVTVAYLMDPYGTRRYLGTDALTDILALGKSSVFARELINVANPMFTEAEASITGNEHQGLLLLTGRLVNESINPLEARDILIDKARSVIERGVDAHELQRVKNRQKSQYILSALDYVSLGQRLALEVMHGESPDKMLERYLTLTEYEVRQAAVDILDKTNPAVLIYKPDENLTSTNL